MNTLFETILTAMEARQDLMLVSIIKTEGSTPRGAGAHMLVSAAGRIWGTVGGGPMEGLALERCKTLLTAHQSYKEQMILRDDTPQGVGSVCGGNALLLFGFIGCDDDAVGSAARLARELLEQRIPCWLILQAGETWGLCVRGGGQSAGFTLPGELWQSLSEKPVLAGDLYIQPLLRPERVVVFGGGHVAQALVPVLSHVGFRCIVVDDRPEYCAPVLFPTAEQTLLLPLGGWDTVLEITDRDLLCIMTRGHEKDIDCLCLALRTPARYIGLMGSRRKIAYTNERLRQRGFSDADIARIVTPIGLAIGAETPAEIAVSIAAQLIAVRAGK